MQYLSLVETDPSQSKEGFWETNQVLSVYQRCVATFVPLPIFCICPSSTTFFSPHIPFCLFPSFIINLFIMSVLGLYLILYFCGQHPPKKKLGESHIKVNNKLRCKTSFVWFFNFPFIYFTIFTNNTNVIWRKLIPSSCSVP